MTDIVRVEDKVIGQVDNGVFIKCVQGSIHMIHTPKAWCVDMSAWEQIKDLMHTVRIVDTDTGHIYEITADDFCRVAKVMNRGFGNQYMVLMKYWRRSDNQQGLLFG